MDRNNYMDTVKTQNTQTVLTLLLKQSLSVTAGFSFVGTLATSRITLAIVCLAALACAGAAATAITSNALAVWTTGTVS